MVYSVGPDGERRKETAQNRSARISKVFFSGEDALKEVAMLDGEWNWALVGPDPKKLPLAGGGMGGVEEMRGIVGERAHCFGLLRMTFGVGNEARTKFVAVHASDNIDSGRFSQLEHGRALASKPQMMKAIRAFTSVATEIHIQSQEDCTVELVVDKLSQVVRGVDAALVTVDNFRAAVKAHEEQHPEEVIYEADRLDQISFMSSLQTPRPQVVEPEHIELAAVESTKRLRKKVKLFAKGDMVEVWSILTNEWILDGEVTEVSTGSFLDAGNLVVAGSLKVEFSNGTRFEWFAPLMAESHLRASLQPRAAPPMVGNLLKLTHSWFETQHMRYLELSKGFLRWWENEAVAKSGAESNNKVYLLDLQQERIATEIRLRSSSTQGVIYIFQAESEEEAETWSQALWAHAGYCQEMREFSKAKDVRVRMLGEFLSQLDSQPSLSQSQPSLAS